MVLLFAGLLDFELIDLFPFVVMLLEWEWQNAPNERSFIISNPFLSIVTRFVFFQRVHKGKNVTYSRVLGLGVFFLVPASEWL